MKGTRRNGVESIKTELYAWGGGTAVGGALATIVRTDITLCNRVIIRIREITGAHDLHYEIRAELNTGGTAFEDITLASGTILAGEQLYETLTDPWQYLTVMCSNTAGIEDPWPQVLIHGVRDT